MFKIVKTPTFIHDVQVFVPVDGGHDPQTLKCKFRVLSADEMNQHDMTSPEGTETYLRAACVEFLDVIGDDDQPIPHSDALRDRLLGLTYVRLALLRTYTEAMIKARLGN